MAALLHDNDPEQLARAEVDHSRETAYAASVKVSYVDHPDFDCPEFVHNILEALPKGSEGSEADEVEMLKGEDYRLPNRPLLNAKSERGLFLRMNLLRRMSSRLL